MEPGRTILKLSQHYQKIGGTIQIGNDSQPLLNPRLDGSTLSFTYLDRDKSSHYVMLAVSNNEIKGIYKSRSYNDTKITGKRL
jgi:hypothetical protein